MSSCCFLFRLCDIYLYGARGCLYRGCSSDPRLWENRLSRGWFDNPLPFSTFPDIFTSRELSVGVLLGLKSLLSHATRINTYEINRDNSWDSRISVWINNCRYLNVDVFKVASIQHCKPTRFWANAVSIRVIPFPIWAI